MSKDRSIISPSELRVLSCMCSKRDAAPIIELSEIASHTGIRDSDEILRALYTLEGKSLVQPKPEGDFTSSQWQVTEHGVRALKMLVPTESPVFAA